MFKVWCYNTSRNEYFIKEFYDKKKFNDFTRKCKFSEKIKIIAKEVIDI